MLASLGLGLSLLATVVIYHAGSYSLGQVYDLSYTKLVGAAATFPAGTVRLAYLLAVLGFGTKVGFFPVHTWLPDAHSEAPTPVSALLSGALLATCFYAILRYYQITERAAGAAFARHVLAGFGVATLLLGALYLASQRDLKRMLAYSSVEHMGILAVGMSFASPLAVAGVLLHVLRPRGSQRHRLFRCWERGPKNADEGPRAYPGRYRPAPVERSLARRGDVGPVRAAPVRHVPL